MASAPGPPRILIVEGVNDQHVVKHVWNRTKGEDPPFEIRPKGNIDRLLKGIPDEIRVRNRQVLGIVADANRNPQGRWQGIADRLRREGIEVPDEMRPDGTILNSSPRVGIWLMPNNDSRGELEHFFEQLIPENDAMWPRAEHYINGIPQDERQFTSGKKLRAIVYAWLAAREEPFKMGEAIGAGDLNVRAPLAKQFCSWLHELFVQSPNSTSSIS